MSLPLANQRKIMLLGQFIIPINKAVSNILDADLYAGWNALVIMGPGAATTGTISLVSGIDDSSSSTFVVVQQPPGTNLTIAGTACITVSPVAFPQLVLSSSSNEAAQRTFNVWGARLAVTSP